jgi:hypothetical protein
MEIKFAFVFCYTVQSQCDCSASAVAPTGMYLCPERAPFQVETSEHSVCTDTILNLIAPHEETCGAAPLSIFFHLSNMQQLASTRPNETTSKFDQRDIFRRQPARKSWAG